MPAVLITVAASALAGCGHAAAAGHVGTGGVTPPVRMSPLVGRSDLAGTYAHTLDFVTPDGVHHPVVFMVYLRDGGIWRMLSPLTRPDGSTKPFWLYGTYVAHGDVVRLTVHDGSPFFTFSVMGDRLREVRTGVVYTRL